MHLMYFTEQPMSAYPEQAGRDFGATALMFSNKHFDPVEGSRLYNNYIEQYMLAEEVGVDGIMLNEHHNAPFCMQAKANVFASLLAGMTKRVKIVLLGNPLPLTVMAPVYVPPNAELMLKLRVPPLTVVLPV